MTQKEIDFVRECIATDIHRFYVWTVWLAKRQEILKADKYECQEHKRRGQYKRATTVHHVMHVREHPELALSRWYVDSRGVRHRNLLAVCRSCHNELHPEKSAKRAAGAAQKEKYVNEERW